MIKKLQLISLVLVLSVFVKGQNGTPQSFEYEKSKISATEPPSQQWNEWFNLEVEKFLEKNKVGKTAGVTYSIPVVFHVIHTGEAVGTFPNLSVATIASQLAILNADYSGTGLNVGNVPTPFASLVANTGTINATATNAVAAGIAVAGNSGFIINSGKITRAGSKMGDMGAGAGVDARDARRAVSARHG
jgi:hypothetical protein